MGYFLNKYFRKSAMTGLEVIIALNSGFPDP